MFLIEVKGDIKIKALGSLHDARWQAGPDPKDLFIYNIYYIYIYKFIYKKNKYYWRNIENSNYNPYQYW